MNKFNVLVLGRLVVVFAFLCAFAASAQPSVTDSFNQLRQEALALGMPVQSVYAVPNMTELRALMDNYEGLMTATGTFPPIEMAALPDRETALPASPLPTSPDASTATTNNTPATVSGTSATAATSTPMGATGGSSQSPLLSSDIFNSIQTTLEKAKTDVHNWNYDSGHCIENMLTLHRENQGAHSDARFMRDFLDRLENELADSLQLLKDTASLETATTNKSAECSRIQPPAPGQIDLTGPECKSELESLNAQLNASYAKLKAQIQKIADQADHYSIFQHTQSVMTDFENPNRSITLTSCNTFSSDLKRLSSDLQSISQ